ncbi:MAG: hypothetical protein H6566_20190 [Lewinellaceae bacterium]|nr:hypothetical protein [Lewinellaceae bacterium]
MLSPYHPDQEKSTVYLLDFETYTLTEICQYNRFNYDAATSSECMLPPCELYADLDLDDSSGDSLNNYTVFTCASPVGVAYPDVGTFSPFPLIPCGLSCSAAWTAPGIPFLQRGAFHICSRQQHGKLAVYQPVVAQRRVVSHHTIRNTLYYNDAAAPAPGARQVAVSLYSSFYNSLPSLSTIVLPGIARAGNGYRLRSLFWRRRWKCKPIRQFWYPLHLPLGRRRRVLQRSSTVPLTLYPILLTDSAGCQNTDTLYISQPDSLWAAIGSAAAFVCGDNGTLSAAAQGAAPALRLRLERAARRRHPLQRRYRGCTSYR